ncbi:MAG: hypothetical protein ACRDH5_19740, partial [bacterium]
VQIQIAIQIVIQEGGAAAESLYDVVAIRISVGGADRDSCFGGLIDEEDPRRSLWRWDRQRGHEHPGDHQAQQAGDGGFHSVILHR